MIIFGQLEDNINLLTAHYLYRFFNSYFIPWMGHPVGKYFEYYESNQPLMWIPFVYLAKFFDPIYIYNFYIVIAKILFFVFVFLFLNKFLANKKIAGLLALVSVFIPYLEYHSRSHADLAQIWLYPAYFMIMLANFKSRYLKFALLGIATVLITLISNYLGYFILLFTFIFYSVYYLLSLVKNKGSVIVAKEFLQNILIYLVSFVVPLILLLWPYINSNYIKVATNEISDSKIISNSLEDFFYFSSRPWYYFLPPTDNLVFGSYSNNILNFLENDWGYWLANNYFVSEHGASFLGLTNIIIAIVGLVYLKKKSALTQDSDKSTLSWSFLITGIILAILTMPPYFTLAGIKIFMPSYLLMQLFPMFRSLVRLGPLVFLCFILFTGYGYKNIYESLVANKNKLIKSFSLVVLIILTLISIVEFYVPFRYTTYQEEPSVYKYIRNATEKESVIVLYPYNKSGEVTFWMRSYQRALVNPGGFSAPNFDSQDFTEELITCAGLSEAKDLGADHLLFFKDIGSDKAKAIDFFENQLKSNILFEYKSEKINSEVQNTLSSYRDIGGDKESVILYDLKNFSSNTCVD